MSTDSINSTGWLIKEIMKTLQYARIEQEMTGTEIIGVLEIIKASVLNEVFDEGEEEEEEEE